MKIFFIPKNLIYIHRLRNFRFRKEKFILRVMGTQVSYSEETLLSGLRNKDRDCFAVLYDSYTSALHGTISIL